ncbi:MAG TPA: hypothetical protein VNC50_09510, partial [Planctomycetia bacterium]|nr:hypothetical protein [Planctomycetia bacterium]
MTGESGEWIELKGVRTHNLRGFDLRLPIGKMIAIAGVSGSGKSSLAFDTLFAEGQRRFLESASPFLRSMLDRIPRPRVAEIAGLPPTVAVRQESLRRRDPRSTVATLCEIHDYLRVLYARCGEGACPNCGLRIALATLDDMLDDTMARPEGERIHILAPLVRGKVGEHREELLKIKREGYVRARIDGTLALVDSGMQLDPNMAHTIDMVVDRQVVRPGLRERLG